jgi:hypothetical protein
VDCGGICKSDELMLRVTIVVDLPVSGVDVRKSRSRAIADELENITGSAARPVKVVDDVAAGFALAENKSIVSAAAD